jgi:predicted branched-subunit amino acid permease
VRLLCPLANTPRRLLSAAIAGAAAVAAYALPFKLNIVAAIAVAVLACLWLEGRLPVQRQERTA